MTTRGIDFETLSLKDAIDLAVLIEEEARDCYVDLAGQLRLHHTPAAAAFFEKMTRVEEVHRKHLLEQRARLFGDAKVSVRREMLFDIEAPGATAARDQMSLREALEVALRAEEKAKDFFEHALLTVKNPDVGKLFAQLREEEVEHRRLVLAELAATPLEMPWDPRVFEDEPVPQ